MAPRKLQIAAAGLGRMGHRHALNFLNRTPRAELVAAFSPDPKEHEWAREHLELFGQGLDALVIGTASSVHAEEAIKAMQKNLHVLCEKPLSTSVEVCRQVVEEAKKRPHLKVMCGFSRRFDDSYETAFSKVDQGQIGRPIILRSQTCDKHDPSGFFVEYAAWSGGVFVDMSVHDIDLTLWFFGNQIQPKSISAHGYVDNAVGIVEFWGGQIAYYYCTRMMAHGQEDVTEVIGTEGKLSVNLIPQSNLVRQYSEKGITQEVPAHYHGRFEMAFVKEANEFPAACLDDTPLAMPIENAVKAVQIGSWLQEALVTGKQIHFDQSGKRLEKSNL
ncbi:NAD(P)-binding protein [Bimuria novae-zelandiae CBS 107.79]|uniref:NAD(P)-binding protein n=1 Tax=Bimuria novae-zelandiae CBS 107.79 TaxID=1447943 RepID=A0A6A5V2Z5_9PLEO|nr:NAD(P)-binding protein [Bimuria novae-zelandiae CBS 107.79]